MNGSCSQGAASRILASVQPGSSQESTKRSLRCGAPPTLSTKLPPWKKRSLHTSARLWLSSGRLQLVTPPSPAEPRQRSPPDYSPLTATSTPHCLRSCAMHRTWHCELQKPPLLLDPYGLISPRFKTLRGQLFSTLPSGLFDTGVDGFVERYIAAHKSSMVIHKS